MEIKGTSGNDDGDKSLIGTSDSDIIHGLEGNDNIVGNGGASDALFGDDGNDFINANDGGNHGLAGGSGDDLLFGANGKDFIDGGTGNDVMQGGAGSDLYVVDSSGDSVVESANQGIDSINTLLSFTLPENVENLFLDGNDNLNGTGNNLDNTIYGNDGNNILKGGDGNDTLSGRFGTNTIDGGSGTNTLEETGNVDFTLTPTSLTFGTNVDTLTNIQKASFLGGFTDNKMDASVFKGSVELFGNSGSDQLIGGAGDDFLEGDHGNDRFTGGAGNDTIDGGIDIDGVIESGNVNFTLTNTSLKGKGTDTLKSIEFAELVGGSSDNTLNTTQFDLGNVTLFGRAGNDILKTGKGNDTLRGEAGDDTMSGGAGIDTYFVDSTNDQVIEASATGGIDTILSSVSFTLGANVEQLTLAGATSNTNGTGNELNNTIAGDANRNTLKGLDGKDTLTGGLGDDILIGGNGTDTISGNGGNDSYVFDTGAAFNSSTIGLDIITQFINTGLEADKLVLDKTTFTELKSIAGSGFSVAGEFAVVGSSSAAAISSALITYDSSTGLLSYNQNGTASGFGTGGKFASLSDRPSLSAVDFSIQA